MGGRGASSGASIKTVSYENITKQQQSMKYSLNMQKTITISEKGTFHEYQIIKIWIIQT